MTGNLDRETGGAVLDVMTKMVRERGATLAREIALKADRIIELVDGKICKDFKIADSGAEAAREILEDRACVI